MDHTKAKTTAPFTNFSASDSLKVAAIDFLIRFTSDILTRVTGALAAMVDLASAAAAVIPLELLLSDG